MGIQRVRAVAAQPIALNPKRPRIVVTDKMLQAGAIAFLGVLNKISPEARAARASRAERVYFDQLAAAYKAMEKARGKASNCQRSKNG